jgi:ankyrin repeat protein
VKQEGEHTGNAALDQALYQASTPEEAEALIKKGANVNAKNTKNGWPCIYKCAYLARFAGGRSEANVAYVLLKHGADVNVWTPEGNTPLGVAVMGDDKELVDLFVEHGADVNFCKPDHGCTALHVAAINGNVPLVEYLIQRGAKVDAKDATGKMPVDCAREYKEEATVQFLVAQTASKYAAAEVRSDDSLPLSRITEETVLNAKCKRCSKTTTRQSLMLYAGNDFYVCPKCAAMFCDQCILTLPLTGSPGYAKCPACDVQLKRAIPGEIG